jgi:hypothetical protein
MSRRAAVVLACIAAAAVALWAWRSWWPDDKRDIRSRLHELADDFNQRSTEGLGAVARAARLGTYFTEDVVIELGQGSPPIRGRDTIIGMAARLQLRTSAYRLELLDVNVDLRSPTEADVRLTAAFRSTGGASDGSIDAQEVALKMLKRSDEWRIGHVAAVDPFR